MILPGVTRDSILTLAREHENGTTKLAGLPEKLKVSERKLTMKDIVAAKEAGKLREMFGSGTAAIVSPINNLGYEGQDIAIPVESDGLGAVANVMLREIVGRQTGEIESAWSYKVPADVSEA